jgi:hypothetical protein
MIPFEKLIKGCLGNEIWSKTLARLTMRQTDTKLGAPLPHPSLVALQIHSQFRTCSFLLLGKRFEMLSTFDPRHLS